MRAHNVFHVSFLKKYAHDSNNFIDWNVIQVEPKGEFQLDLIHILEWKVTTLWNQAIGQVKIQWKHLIPDEATWDREITMFNAYSFLFNF